MPGGLMQIVATGAQNHYIPRNESNQYMTHIFEGTSRNRSVQVLRNSDVEKMKDLYFRDGNLSLDEFKNVMKDVRMGFQIGEATICEYDFQLLMELNPPKKVRDTIILKIPSDMTISTIPLITLQNHDVRINLKNINHNFEEIKIILQGTFLDSEPRRRMAQNGHEFSIQQFQHVVTTNAENLNNNRIEIIASHLKNIIKGFFIMGNIENIEEFKIVLNGYDREILDYSMIDTYCRKINDNMIFFSFDGLNNFENNSAESFVGGLNMSRIDNANIYLKLFDNTLPSYKIIALNHNILRILIGNVAAVYSYVFPALIVEERNVVPRLFPHRDIQQEIIVWVEENREFTEAERNLECPISKNLIEKEYCQCSICKYNYDFNNVRQWLRNNDNCPMCRTIWTNNVKYIRTEQ